MLKITVNFNRTDITGDKVLVAAYGDMKTMNIRSQLQEGLRVLLREPNDFTVEAVLEPVEVNGRIDWYGLPDWSTRRDVKRDLD